MKNLSFSAPVLVLDTKGRQESFDVFLHQVFTLRLYLGGYPHCTETVLPSCSRSNIRFCAQEPGNTSLMSESPHPLQQPEEMGSVPRERPSLCLCSEFAYGQWLATTPHVFCLPKPEPPVHTSYSLFSPRPGSFPLSLSPVLT